ncbi:MAG: hypothetical protein D5S03_04410, partial [Desulfonatronospira sp. MSAO_Bac3]
GHRAWGMGKNVWEYGCVGVWVWEEMETGQGAKAFIVPFPDLTSNPFSKCNHSGGPRWLLMALGQGTVPLAGTYPPEWLLLSVVAGLFFFKPVG